MRVVDALYALPFMFVVILLMVVFGRSILLVFLGIGAVEWLTMARVVRGQVMALRHRPFVLAAEAAGAPPGAILLRHVLPNVAGVALAYLLLTVPQVVMVESFLSFLGLGVQEPLTSLGILVHDGRGGYGCRAARPAGAGRSAGRADPGSDHPWRAAARPARAVTLYAVERLGVAIGGMPLVHDVGFAVEPGRCTALVGASGSGKSLSCLGALRSERGSSPADRHASRGAS